MVRRMFVMLATLVVIGVFAPSADAEFVYHNVGGSAEASWDTCRQVPIGATCAFAQVEAETARTDIYDRTRQHDCVWFIQYRGVKDTPGGIQSSGQTYAIACEAASVVVAASLTHGWIHGELPASDCNFDPATRVKTCTPSALKVSLNWEGVGEVESYSPVTNHYSYEPGQRCLEHGDGARFRRAVVSGSIAGLPAPLGDPVPDHTALFFGGTMIVGTDFGCYD